ncbi:MAG: phosphatase PAP2 family protein [Planctomycetota bacterium]
MRFAPSWLDEAFAEDTRWRPLANRVDDDAGWFTRTWRTVRTDHVAFYDTDTMLGLGAGIGLAALSAETQLDRDIYEDVLPEWRTDEVRELRDTVLPAGEGALVLPLLAATALVAPRLGAEAPGEWAERSLRAIVVGAPPMLALQRLIGAGRPDDPNNTTSSEWEPFEHTNGVSGHAFIGSVPLLTVARMQDDPWIDGVCYVGSTLVAAARLQGSRHYFSQVALGWWIGWLATGAVDDAELGRTSTSSTSFLPYVSGDEVGFLVEHRF